MEKYRNVLNITNPNLRNQLTYNPETGSFSWLVSGSGRKLNLSAGCVKGVGPKLRREITFEQKEYTSGQLAWVFMTGKFPDFIIDHIDQDSLNDKWVNLRRGDECVAQRNVKKSIRNSTGVVGVTWNKKSSKFKAFIGIGGKQAYLGSSVNFLEAVVLRKRAEIQYNYSPKHGT